MKRFLTLSAVFLLILCVLSGLGALILRVRHPLAETTENVTENHNSTTDKASDSLLNPETAESSESERQTETPPETTVPPTALILPTLSCSQAFVYDLTVDQFLFEKGTDEAILPASITKLLTALCALHYMPADARITPGDEQELLIKGSSIAYVKSNHTLTLEMLIEGMLLPSGNDAAFAVAAGVARYIHQNPNMNGQAAVNAFMTLANDYAKSLGCTNTYFTVPDGLAYEGHTTTAHDLIILGKAALNNDIIAKYAATVTDNVTYASGHTMTWTNSNLLINPESSFYSPYVTGLKTGSLTDAYSILVSADIHGHTYLLGLFGSPTKEGRYIDAHTILDLLLIKKT